MKTELAGIELYYLAKELAVLKGGRVDSIYMPARGDFIFRFHISGLGKKILRVLLPGIAYLAVHTPANPESPHHLCLQLRKHLKGGRVVSVGQVNSERILKIEIEKKDASYAIFIELFSKGNLLLTKKEGDIYKIVSATLYKSWRDREIKRHQAYELPPEKISFTDIDEAKMKEVCGDGKMNVAKWLATSFSLGGIYAKEVCIFAGVDKESTVGDANIKKLAVAIDKLRNMKLKPQVVKEGEDVVDITPIPLKFYEKNECVEKATFSEALDDVFGEELRQEKYTEHVSGRGKKFSKLQDVMNSQKEKEKELLGQIDENTVKGELLYSHYQDFSKLFDIVKELTGKFKGKELDRAFKDLGIKEVNQKDKKITVEVKEK
jgi:predicted ribosome quality control (RQC) complex YloA/Tae2 family protein